MGHPGVRHGLVCHVGLLRGRDVKLISTCDDDGRAGGSAAEAEQGLPRPDTSHCSADRSARHISILLRCLCRTGRNIAAPSHTAHPRHCTVSFGLTESWGDDACHLTLWIFYAPILAEAPICATAPTRSSSTSVLSIAMQAAATTSSSTAPRAHAPLISPESAPPLGLMKFYPPCQKKKRVPHKFKT